MQFQYMKYGMDKHLHPRQECPCQVSPYGFCFTNGYYYLLCQYQGAENIGYNWVDRIQSPVLLEDQQVESPPPGLDLERYVREQVYPFPDKAVRVVLHCEEDLHSDVLDRFGMETQLQDNGNGTFDAIEILGTAICGGLSDDGAALAAVGNRRDPADWVGELSKNAGTPSGNKRTYVAGGF